MRYVFGFLCVCALGVMPLVGCSETTGDGGNGGDGGSGGTVALCEGNVCPCSEAGINAAIEAGGDAPYTFDCVGAQTVVTKAEIAIDNDVILDGEGNLTVDGNGNHVVFSVPEGVTAELRGFAVTGGGRVFVAGGISNSGNLLLTSSTVSGNTADQAGGGIYNSGTLTLTNSTVSGNEAIACGNIANIDLGIMTLTNSTVSSPGDICNEGNLMLFIHSTVWNPGDTSVFTGVNSTTTLENTLIDGECLSDGDVVSNGYNIESPRDTCGLDQDTDRVLTEAQLNLGPLADNGGPTMTHALLTEPTVSEAIDRIPETDCEVTEDQRGFPRDSVCDVGAFEVQVTDCAGEEIFTACTIDDQLGYCQLEQCATFDCSGLEDRTYCVFAVLGDGTLGVCEAGRCTKPEDCTGLVDGWDCIKGEVGSCVDGECVTPP